MCNGNKMQTCMRLHTCIVIWRVYAGGMGQRGGGHVGGREEAETTRGGGRGSQARVLMGGREIEASSTGVLAKKSAIPVFEIREVASGHELNPKH